MTAATDCPSGFTIVPGLRPEHVEIAAAGYWNAFSGKLRYPLGPEQKAVTFLRQVLNPSHAMSAVSEDGGFLGVAGFKTPDGAFVGGGMKEMAQFYGWVGGLARGLLIGILERECEKDTLLMDGIFVLPVARGLGVGSALLGAVEHRAQSLRLKQVRLDVIDENPRARALYLRMGFAPAATMSIGPLRHVFGFRSATTMLKRVGDEQGLVPRPA